MRTLFGCIESAVAGTPLRAGERRCRRACRIAPPLGAEPVYGRLSPPPAGLDPGVRFSGLLTSY